jgi:hypothetical protein
MNAERKFSIVNIVKRLGIPDERLGDLICRCFVFACERGTANPRTKAIFSRRDVYGIALFEYFVKERFFSPEEAEKFTKLWLQTARGEDSSIKPPRKKKQKTSDPGNVLLFIKQSTPAGDDLTCEPVGIYGKRKSEGGFHFFKALGEFLKKKLKGKHWDDFYVVNFGKIKKQVDAQLL